MQIKKTKCGCGTQMPPIITNSKDSQGHGDKFLIPVEISCQSKYSCEM